MKVIDLLNKIANGEEVPKKVFYKTGGEYTGGYYWNYDESFRDYKDKAGDYVFNAGNYHIIDMLNMEVEIIEEDKKIEKVNTYVLCDYDFKNKDDDNNLIATNILDKALEEYSHKINEIIDYLEEKE